MEFAIKVFSKKFTDANRKSAYLKLSKWLASNILYNKKDFENISYKVKDVSEEDYPAFELQIFAILEEKEVREKNCRICQESHSLFYLNAKADCNSCNAKAYVTRLDDLVKERKSLMITKIHKITKEE